MVGVATMEVAAEGLGDLGMAGVVGAVQHELAQGSEVALDAVEIAGRGRRRDQLHVVRVRPRTRATDP